MGRTVFSFGQAFGAGISGWKILRRGFRREDQLILDRLIYLARLHFQAGGYASPPYPFEPS